MEITSYSKKFSDNDIGKLAAEAQIRRVYVLAWRDSESPDAGGSEVHLSEVLKRWSSAGLEVTLRTSKVPKRPVLSNRDNYRLIRKGGSYQSFLRSIAAGLIHRDGPRDAVVEVWNGFPFFTPLWTQCPNIAILHHFHGPLWPTVLPTPLAGFGSLIEKVIAPPIYRQTPIVTLSQSSRNTLREETRLKEKNISVVQPGISEDFFPGGSLAPEPTVVAVGRLTPYKKIDRLISVLAEVRKSIPTVRLEIIGTGNAEYGLRLHAARLGGGSWVRFLGHVSKEDLIDSYRRAWIVASCSISEGWGMSITEAASCQTPAVATRIPGHVDAIEDGYSGYLVESEEEFIEKITELLKNSTLRNKFGLAAAERAKSFSWERTAFEIFRILAETSSK